MFLLVTILLLREVVSGAVLCPDQSQCPEGTTCCLMQSSQYGCCPVPKGVCCSDHQHCCPQGYNCNNETCVKGGLSIPYINKIPVLERLIARNSIESHSTKVFCDAIHYCQGGNTCCRNRTGEWACCGYPQATCCANGLNCCPNEFTCEISASICTQNGLKIPMETKKPSQKIISLSSSVSSDSSAVKCDSVHSCPDGNTCCRQNTGHWSCCPHPQTVCCFAGTMCCPKDYTSGVSTSSRAMNGLSIPLVSMISAVESALSTSVSSDSSAVKCDSLYSCPDGNTCCRQNTGHWSCCPHPQTVCCFAGTRCCPKDYTSGVSTSSRAMNGLSIPLVSMISAVESALSTSVSSDSSAVKCDSVYSCPDGNTCCRQNTGHWSCCPHPQTVCCFAGTRCCPKDYTSGVSTSSRAMNGLSIPLVSMISAVESALSTSVSSDSSAVKCDSVYSCPDGNTCCRQNTGHWSCCPHPQTVCCFAGTRCCPKDYTSGVSTSSRAMNGLSIPLVSMISAVESALSTSVSSDSSAVKCDSVYSCPDGNTCCRQNTGHWSCCPHPQTVCCFAGTRCCPKDYTSGVSTSSRAMNGLSIPLVSMISAVESALSTSVSSDSSAVKCDSVYSCPDGNTCCRQITGHWSCCPHPQTVCCFAGTRCCPKDYTSGVSTSSRAMNGLSIPLVSMISAVESALSTSVSSDSSAVKCDSLYSCPDGNTCCRQNTGHWSCCPHPQTVCCFAGTRCCPKDYTSGVSTSSRAMNGLSIPLVSMISAVESALSTSVSSDSSAVKCDSVYSCPDGNTCCRQNTGHWSCCPHPQTVCCFAGTRCCPKDYTSGVSTSSRAMNGLSIPLVSMISAVESALSTSVSSDSSAVKCDSVYSCPDGNTCCRQNTGHWSCCPHPQTVCCFGGTRCCPKDFSTLFKTSSSLSVPVNRMKPVMEINALSIQFNSGRSVTYCDNLHYCSAENTCCRLPSGSWGCCPIPSATCCNDGVHCCPHGMNCDAENSFCTTDSIRIPWFNKKPALIATDVVNSVGRDSSVVNCDKTYFCKDGLTCCPTAMGRWGCCPFPNGQCCKDKQTCCPRHYKCSGGPKTMTCKWKIWN
ncbi:progranulin-like [Callorhinchus milii]|uniref:progranulin-like n=1 Tax=Callorhinchus milii TaxID=7868 RepID=UPI001C3F578C|nr:progranulin-like [Callorhinchus milii]XP_042187868.1 progranulin-like [Callorhinchus milii]